MVNLSRESSVTRTKQISRGKGVIYHDKSVPWNAPIAGYFEPSKFRNV